MRVSSPYYLTLVSSDQGGYADLNSSSAFRNQLGEELFFPGDENWGVALHQVQCTNHLTKKKTRLIKIQSDIIAPQYSHNDILTLFPRKTPNFKADRLINYEPQNKEYFPLRSEIIKEIGIKFIDANEAPIKFQDGQPTVVVLEFKKMVGLPTYTVRFQSQDDPNGNFADFTATLPPAMNLDPSRKWSAAITSIMYSGVFKQAPPVGDDELKFDYWLPETPETIQTASVPLPEIKFRDNNELARVITAALSKVRVQLAGTGPPVLNFSQIHRNPISNRLIMRSLLDGVIKIPLSYALMVGAGANMNEDGYVPINCSAYDTVEFEHGMNWNAWVPNSLVLYSNFVDYSCVGSVLAPVLKVFPVRGLPAKGQYARYEALSVEKHPIIFSQLNNLRFQIRRLDGRPADFHNDMPNNIIISMQFIQEE